jgi:hypothetical protein
MDLVALATLLVGVTEGRLVVVPQRFQLSFLLLNLGIVLRNLQLQHRSGFRGIFNIFYPKVNVKQK